MSAHAGQRRVWNALWLPRRFAGSLRARFLLGMGVMLLPLVVLAGIAHFSFYRVTAAIDDVVEEATEEVSAVLRVEILIQQAMIVAHDVMAQGPADSAARDRITTAHQAVQKAFDGIGAGPFALAQERSLIQSAEGEWQQGRRISEALLLNPGTSGDPALLREMERAHAYHIRALERLDQVHTLAQQEMDAQLAYAISLRRKLFVAVATVFALGLGVAAAVGTALARSVMTPLHALEAGAERLGAGDLSHRVRPVGHDELAHLARAFNSMADKLARTQALLRELSTRDSLTGLLNYREFQRQLAEEVERSRRYGHPISLLMLDIDHFKTINDAYGHLAGDKALRAVAALIRGEVRPADLAARYGGEEFALVLPETPGPGALTLAERLRRRVADEAIIATTGCSVAMTVSIGVATYPDDKDSVQALVSAADQALYVAKSGGRNRVCRWDGLRSANVRVNGAELQSHPFAASAGSLPAEESH